MPSPLFSGAATLRDPRERIAFIVTLAVALPAAYGIGLLLHEDIGPPEVALFIVVAMLYVTLARGRLIGSSLMIHEAQYPRVFSIVKRTCTALDLPMPLIFVREDNFVPVVALGFGEPYALVISSHWIEAFEDDELAFMIGRELGHIAAGHTRFLSILSVNGNENPIVSLIFGAWLRTCTMTCDRVGLLACGSLDAAMRAIAISAFHHFGRHINLAQFAEQGREIASDGTLRLGEWLGGEPYATRRIASMQNFMSTPLYAQSKAWFDREIAAEPPRYVPPAGARVERRDCAGIWRRSLAFFIDVIVVSALVTAITHGHGPGVVSVAVDRPAAQASAKPASADSDDDDTVRAGPVTIDEAGVHVDERDTPWGRFITGAARYAGNVSALAFMAYFSLLVGFAGQTFGMMITGLRVVRTDFRPVGLGRALVKYVPGLLLWPIVALCAPLPFTKRVWLHDRISGTRVIRAERQMARAAAATTAA